MLHGLRLAKSFISKVIVTGISIGVCTIHMYVSGKYGGTSVDLPDITSCQIRREHSVKPDINNRYMLLLVRKLKQSREFSTLIDELNTVQSGRSSVLAAGSEPRQFLRELFSDNAVQKLEGPQRGEK